jgi:hypothetical protein
MESGLLFNLKFTLLRLEITPQKLMTQGRNSGTLYFNQDGLNALRTELLVIYLQTQIQ